MSMSLRYYAVFAACSIFLGSSAALAGSVANPLRANDGLESLKGQVIDELNLSDAQKQKIKQIHQQYQGQISQSQESLRSAQQRLSQMMVGTDSSAAIRTQHQEVIQLRQALDNLRFESMLEMRAVLTIEQRRQFAQLMQQRQDNSRRFDRGK